MHFKKLLALLVSAALMLSLLAGCGNGKALSQVIVDLLDNLYSNVSVEADSDLTAALKQAAAEGGTEEEILSRMIEILNHKGGSITFTLLGSGQQGEHGVTLYFQPGTDPDAAARNALAQWAGTLGTLPDDGSYQGDVAMIEAENGYYIALDVEVLKAGKPDKPDKDDDEPETQEPPEPDKGYTVSEDGMTYSVSNAEGLKAVAELVNNDSKLDIDITLTGNIDLTGEWTPIGKDDSKAYTGTFDGGGHTITGLNVNQEGTNYVGLIGYLGSGGKVKDVTLENVQITNDNSSGSVGGVAGYCFFGNIENCSVSGSVTGSGDSSDAGGVVGYQQGGSITGCSSSATVKGTERAGGVAGGSNGTIENCSVSGSVISTDSNSDAGGVVGWKASGSLTGCSSSATVQGTSNAGGVVGWNSVISIVTACYSTGAVSGSYAGGVVGINGGVVGINDGTVTACYHAGTVQGGSGNTGGVVGRNPDGTVTACYWSGSPDAGIGGGKQAGSNEYYKDTHQNMVTTVEVWDELVAAMDTAGYILKGSCPTPTGLTPKN